MSERRKIGSGSLSAKTIAIGIAVFLVTALQVGGAYWSSTKNIAALDAIEEDVTTHREKLLPLKEITKEIQIDVIQVQQWLTDISATRGLDGLDDGMSAAAEFAQKFEKDLTKALALARDLGLAEIEADLSQVREAFGPYYEMGREMASAYVSGGPAAGNPMMGSFDETAEEINTSVERMLNAVAETEQAKAGEVSALIRDSEEAAAGFQSFTILIGLLGLGVALGIAAFLLLRIVGPITRMIDVMEGLAKEDLTVEITGTERQDEIGRMAKALQVFREHTVEVERMRAEQEERKRQAEQERSETMGRLADQFENQVGKIVEGVAVAAGDMQSNAEALSTTAEHTGRQAAVVVSASDEASENVQTVASAAEELSSSIDEIGRQVSESTRIAKAAVEDAGRTNTQVESLVEAAEKVDEVVNLISDIAEQTNLLALNATIEAARAGEAGKGFAVVATEVKSLANQTAKATEDIGGQISAMQGATEGAAAAIKGIAETIARVDEIASAIAAAVEEQGAATREIANSVQQAAAGTNQVSESIDSVTQAASETGQSASQTLEASHELSRNAEHLRTEVNKFVSEVRAA